MVAAVPAGSSLVYETITERGIRLKINEPRKRVVNAGCHYCGIRPGARLGLSEVDRSDLAEPSEMHRATVTFPTRPKLASFGPARPDVGLPAFKSKLRDRDGVSAEFGTKISAAN